MNIQRMWINQPSELQILHHLHGTNVLAVREGKWLSLSWHRMESGRYEIVAYVN